MFFTQRQLRGKRARPKRRLRSGRTQTSASKTRHQVAGEGSAMQEYETIKGARAMLQACQANAPSERTVTGYVAKTALIMRRAGPDADIEALINQAKKTQSASTWFSRRAALMHSFRLGIGQLLAEQDTMQRAVKAAEAAGSSPSLERWQKAVRKMGRMVEWHKRLQDEPGPPVEQRRPRHSKRRDLRGLSEDWREKLVTRMPNYRLAALTNAVTGCRSDELLSGVQLEIRGGHLVATIIGSKVTEKTGQPWRRLYWSTDSASPLIRALIAEVQAGASVALIKDAKAYSGAMRAAGGREWPKRKTTVTPYCMRHALAADMKASGMNAAEISAGLGHCSNVTKQYYGTASQGGGARSVAPLKVEAERKVMVARSKPVSILARADGKKPNFPK